MSENLLLTTDNGRLRAVNTPLKPLPRPGIPASMRSGVRTCAIIRSHAHYPSEIDLIACMATDNELLREYAQTSSEPAFKELVQRHVNMVYAAALRETDGNPHLAQDLAQSVFVELARKANSLEQHPALAGWLYTCVRFTAANVRRAEDRRQRRQEEYQSMADMHASESPDSTWRQIRPVLDDALHELAETDRAALVLRFFEDLSLREIGMQLGLNENAARMRVDRALEKLQELLSRRGITSTSSVLAAALVAGAAVSAPAGLAATVTTTAMAPALASQASDAAGHSLHSRTSMKCYLITTATVFGVLSGVHIWRASVEGMRLMYEPVFLSLTVAAVALCCWGCYLVVRYPRAQK
jgi:RNA polymerase sigma factor (sigma-70 family)